MASEFPCNDNILDFLKSNWFPGATERYEGESEPNVYSTEENWNTLDLPFSGTRVCGLYGLRQAIEAHGLTSVLPGSRPDDERVLRSICFAYGTSIAFLEDLKEGQSSASEMRLIPGVCLHPGNAPQLTNSLRGAVNPHMGYARLHGTLNKWTEYQLANRFAPGIMASSLNGLDIADFWRNEAVALAHANAKSCLSGLDRLNAWNKSVSSVAPLVPFFELLWEFLKRQYPKGSVVKHCFSSASAREYQFVATWVYEPAELVNRFQLFTTELLRAHQSDTSLTLSEILDREMYNMPLAVFDMVMRPERCMIQERLDIARYPDGTLMEFRVDFIDGEPASTLCRHAYPYFPVGARLCEDALRSFFLACPPEYRYLSGGADIVLVGGALIPQICEFNFGAESSFIGADLWGNSYRSAIQGKPTLLQQCFEAFSSATVERMSEVLQYVVDSVSDMAPTTNWDAESAALKFRDMLLQLYEQKLKSADEVLSDIHKLLSSVHRLSDYLCAQFAAMEKGAEMYVRENNGQ